jgi:broad specificity phosphatase PhoE
MKRPLFLTVASLIISTLQAVAQQPIFVVRHAERADAGAGGATTMATDPDLSDTGRARAQSLASMLRDARITAIFVTEYKRTQQTAEPLAKALGIQPSIITAKDSTAVVDKIRAATGPVLVVGHSNTIPEILAKLGVENPPKVGDADYDDLFMVTGAEKKSLVRLHFR